jgi:DNA-binding SARP family transcriptional activator
MQQDRQQIRGGEGWDSPQPQILVLGPIEIVRDDRSIPVGGHCTRVVLSALVMGLCHSVSDDRLMDAVWGDCPPDTGVAALQSHISRLRRLLGHDAIKRSHNAYVLDVDPGMVDACRFERAFDRAGDLMETDPDTARELCHDALGLWRGPPFGDLCDTEFAQPEVVRLEELRIDAIELYLEATVATDHPVLAVPALQAAVTDHPYREKLWYLLMRALSLGGRRVEALRAYQDARLVLGEVGLEPALDLQGLEQEIYAEADAVRAHLSA